MFGSLFFQPLVRAVHAYPDSLLEGWLPPNVRLAWLAVFCWVRSLREVRLLRYNRENRTHLAVESTHLSVENTRPWAEVLRAARRPATSRSVAWPLPQTTHAQMQPRLAQAKWLAQCINMSWNVCAAVHVSTAVCLPLSIWGIIYWLGNPKS